MSWINRDGLKFIPVSEKVPQLLLLKCWVSFRPTPCFPHWRNFLERWPSLPPISLIKNQPSFIHYFTPVWSDRWFKFFINIQYKTCFQHQRNKSWVIRFTVANLVICFSSTSNLVFSSFKTFIILFSRIKLMDSCFFF